VIRNKRLALEVRVQVLIKRPKRPKRIPLLMQSTKNWNPKLCNFFSKFFVLIYKIFSMFRGLEQLSGAICWRDMTCSTCATPDTRWLLIDLCAPFLHYALSEENHCCKPVWSSDEFRLWRESDVCIRFPVNKEGTWIQKVYNSIMCVSSKLNKITDVCCGIRNASGKMMTKSFVKQKLQYCEQIDEF